MEPIIQRQGTRRLSRGLGPFALVVAVASRALGLLGVGGAGDDMKEIAEWFDDPTVLRWALTLIGAILCYVGYEDRISKARIAVWFRWRLWRFRSESGEQRLSRVKGELDHLVSRARRMLASEDGTASILLLDQWHDHAMALFKRALNDTAARPMPHDDAIDRISEFESHASANEWLNVNIQTDPAHEVVPPKGRRLAAYTLSTMDVLVRMRNTVTVDLVRLD